ncbi:GspH/FimT family pseudopilin [Pseudomonas matsuisoli]|uniref:Type II secretion system protein H n=1 Tax=Pseudomonas matsuisoli TaxID=1515666 RepID=A0A917Q2E6_9PSED|nr:GspH/FimT family pseudopilin [Pseudomonas matsuisoli]GGK07199.1 type II secretion system protein GspH [Pseudomonas matsuisoli]
MKRRRLQAGFTLLELMIVLLVIGLMTGIGIALLGDSAGQRQRAKLGSLASEFRLARETALRTGQVIGWYLADDSYRYLRLRATPQGPRWSDLNDDGLRDGAWPTDFALAGPRSAAPQMVWLPNGESEGARLQFRSEARTYVVSVSRLGTVSVDDQ